MSLSAGSKPSSGLENDTEEQPVSGPGSAPRPPARSLGAVSSLPEAPSLGPDTRIVTATWQGWGSQVTGDHCGTCGLLCGGCPAHGR